MENTQDVSATRSDASLAVNHTHAGTTSRCRTQDERLKEIKREDLTAQAGVETHTHSAGRQRTNYGRQGGTNEAGEGG